MTLYLMSSVYLIIKNCEGEVCYIILELYGKETSIWTAWKSPDWSWTGEQLLKCDRIFCVVNVTQV